MKKYRLDENDTVVVGRLGMKLYRIIALRDFGNVKTGDRGGYVGNEANLSHEGICWIYDDAKVYGATEISGNARVYGNAEISGHTKIFGWTKISGDIKIYGEKFC